MSERLMSNNDEIFTRAEEAKKVMIENRTLGLELFKHFIDQYPNEGIFFLKRAEAWEALSESYQAKYDYDKACDCGLTLDLKLRNDAAKGFNRVQHAAEKQSGKRKIQETEQAKEITLKRIEFKKWLDENNYGQVEIPKDSLLNEYKPKFCNEHENRRIKSIFGKCIPSSKNKLFCHQVAGLTALHNGKNVCVTTPTGSGKSLIYETWTYYNLEQDKNSTSLFLYPQVALVEDRYLEVEKQISDLNFSIQIGSLYGNKDPRYVFNRNPKILFATIDKIHGLMMSGNQKRRSAESFIENLSLIVVDELHAFSGVLGSHGAQVLSRLKYWQRDHLESEKENRYIACSATIGNPRSLFCSFCSIETEEIAIISNNGAPRSKKDFYIYKLRNVDQGKIYLELSGEIIEKCCDLGLKSIVFTPSRKSVSRLYGRLAGKNKSICKPFHGGMNLEQRTNIINKLKNGEICSVITTNAMELGINIGELDVAIFAGFPLSRTSFWQQFGRVGRSKYGLGIYIPSGEMSDLHYQLYPNQLISGEYFDTVCVDPKLKPVKEKHDNAFPKGESREWFGLRDSIGRTFGIFTQLNNNEYKYLEEVSSPAVFRDYFPNAIFSAYDEEKNQLVSYRVRRIVDIEEFNQKYNLDKCLKKINDMWKIIPSVDKATNNCYDCFIIADKLECYSGEYTFSIPQIHIDYNQEGQNRIIDCFTLALWKGEIRSTFNEYFSSRDGTQDIDPSIIDKIETEGLYIEINEKITSEIIHGLEHLLRISIPIHIMCSNNDISGMVWEEKIFIWDNASGGLGLCGSLWNKIDLLFKEIIKTARERINCKNECEGIEGCPWCLQLTKYMCERKNENLNRKATEEFLKKINI